MATSAITKTLTNGTTADATDVMENFNDLVTFDNNSVVHVDGSKAMTGILTLPASDPTTANQATRKSYVDAADAVVTAAFTAADLVKLTCPSGLKIDAGSTTITFSGGTSSNLVTVTATRLTTIAYVVASVARGVALATIRTTGNQFTVQGAWSVGLSGASNVDWIAVGT